MQNSKQKIKTTNKQLQGEIIKRVGKYITMKGENTNNNYENNNNRQQSINSSSSNKLNNSNNMSVQRTDKKEPIHKQYNNDINSNININNNSKTDNNNINRQQSITTTPTNNSKQNTNKQQPTNKNTKINITEVITQINQLIKQNQNYKKKYQQLKSTARKNGIVINTKLQQQSIQQQSGQQQQQQEQQQQEQLLINTIKALNQHNNNHNRHNKSKSKNICNKCGTQSLQIKQAIFIAKNKLLLNILHKSEESNYQLRLQIQQLQQKQRILKQQLFNINNTIIQERNNNSNIHYSNKDSNKSNNNDDEQSNTNSQSNNNNSAKQLSNFKQISQTLFQAICNLPAIPITTTIQKQQQSQYKQQQCQQYQQQQKQLLKSGVLFEPENQIQLLTAVQTIKRYSQNYQQIQKQQEIYFGRIIQQLFGVIKILKITYHIEKEQLENIFKDLGFGAEQKYGVNYHILQLMKEKQEERNKSGMSRDFNKNIKEKINRGRNDVKDIAMTKL